MSLFSVVASIAVGVIFLLWGIPALFNTSNSNLPNFVGMKDTIQENASETIVTPIQKAQEVKKLLEAKNGAIVDLHTPEFTKDSWNGFVKPSEKILRSKITSTQYSVTQEEGTESPFNNEYEHNTEKGIYVDIVSGEPLFFSQDKYDSGTGWPSFVKPISPEVVILKTDTLLYSERTEVRSAHADSHLGHVFADGPVDRGEKRYCMNSAALRFIAKDDMTKEGYTYLLAQIE